MTLPIKVFRSGLGIDTHAFAEKRPCVIGGVLIPHHRGLAGHSDADVLIHAVCDALLGAMGLADIGAWFPDNDQEFKNIDSTLLLARVRELMQEGNFTLINLDCVILAEEPKIKPYRHAMRERMAAVLQCEGDQIGIKATTMEKMGFVGRSEGVMAQATASLYGPLHPVFQSTPRQ